MTGLGSARWILRIQKSWRGFSLTRGGSKRFLTSDRSSTTGSPKRLPGKFPKQYRTSTDWRLCRDFVHGLRASGRNEIASLETQVFRIRSFDGLRPGSDTLEGRTSDGDTVSWGRCLGTRGLVFCEASPE